MSLDNKGEWLFDGLPPLQYKDTKKRFSGEVKTIVYSDPIRYYDASGRELEEVPRRGPARREPDKWL